MWTENDETTAALTEAPTAVPGGSTEQPTEREPFPEGPVGPPAWVIILIVLGAVMLAAGAAVLIVLLVRRKKK